MQPSIPRRRRSHAPRGNVRSRRSAASADAPPSGEACVPTRSAGTRIGLFGAMLAGVVLLSGSCRHGESQADLATRDAAGSPRNPPPVVRIVKPMARNMTRTLLQPGFVEAYEQTAIYSKVSGFLNKPNVDIGDRIKKGDLLCEVVAPELEAEHEQKLAQVELDKQGVEQAQQLVAVAESNVQTAIAELHEAKADVGRYQAEVVRWTSEVKRLTQMAQEKVVDKQVLDEPQKELESSKAAADSAQAAVAAREAARMSRDADLAKSRVDVEFAKSKVKVSAAEERRAASLLAYTKVTAPYDGVVTVRNANTGDYVQARAGDKERAQGAPIFVVSRTDLVRVFVDVPEAYARYVRAGTKALIRVEAIHGLEIPATVTRTAWDLNVKTRALRTEIDLPVKDYDGLRPGMYVYAKVIVERPGVLAVPDQAIAVEGNETYCFLRVNGKAVKTPVQRGICDGPWDEILRKKSGDRWTPFTGDEEVAVGDLSDIAEGEALAVAEEKAP